MEEEEKSSTPKKKWINSNRGKGFIAGFLMAIACNLSNYFNPMFDNRETIYLAFLAGLATVILVFVVAEVVLKRFGFEGFDVLGRNSKWEGSAYISFFAGWLVSGFVLALLAVIGSEIFPGIFTLE